MEILKDMMELFPLSFKQFHTWVEMNLQSSMGIVNTFDEFEKLTLINHFLGYEKELDDTLLLTTHFERITKYLYIHEDLLTKYPDGIKDYIEELKHMEYEKREKEQEFHKAEKLNPRLAWLLVPRKYSSRPQKTLKDCLIPLKEEMVLQPMVPIIDFWEQAIKDNFNNIQSPF